MFSCNFYEVFKNAFVIEHLQVTASAVKPFRTHFVSSILKIIEKKGNAGKEPDRDM